MKNYVVYDKATGEIIRTGKCPDSMLMLQIKGNENIHGVVEGTADDIEDKIVGGKVKKRSANEIQQRKAALTRAQEAPPMGKLERVVRILRHLKNQGIDLGPDGENL